MDCSTPGLSVPRHLPKFAQVHIRCIGDAVQPSHPLTTSSPSALNLFQHRSFPVGCLFASDDQNTGVSASASILPINIQGWSLLRLAGLIDNPYPIIVQTIFITLKSFLVLLPFQLHSLHLVGTTATTVLSPFTCIPFAWFMYMGSFSMNSCACFWVSLCCDVVGSSLYLWEVAIVWTYHSLFIRYPVQWLLDFFRILAIMIEHSFSSLLWICVFVFSWVKA